MKIFNIDDSLKDIPKIKEKFNLCLGFFDAVHLGHKKIFVSASKKGYKIGAITFNNKNVKNKYITTIAERLFFFKKLGINFVFILPSSEKIINTSYFFFKEKFLDILHPISLFVGEDFKFGKDRLGDIEYLKKFFFVNVVTFKKKNNNKISSSEIRKLIKKGKIKEANDNLGHFFMIFGEIKKKDGNFYIVVKDNKILPSLGFYNAVLNVNKKKIYFLVKIVKRKILIIKDSCNDSYFISYILKNKKINFELISEKKQ